MLILILKCPPTCEVAYMLWHHNKRFWLLLHLVEQSKSIGHDVTNSCPYRKSTECHDSHIAKKHFFPVTFQPRFYYECKTGKNNKWSIHTLHSYLKWCQIKVEKSQEKSTFLLRVSHDIQLIFYIDKSLWHHNQ